MLFAPGCSIANDTIYMKEQINTLTNYLPRKDEISQGWVYNCGYRGWLFRVKYTPLHISEISCACKGMPKVPF